MAKLFFLLATMFIAAASARNTGFQKQNGNRQPMEKNDIGGEQEEGGFGSKQHGFEPPNNQERFPGNQGRMQEGLPGLQGGLPEMHEGFPGTQGRFPDNQGGFPGMQGGMQGGFPGMPGGFPGMPGGFPGMPGQFPEMQGGFPEMQGGFPGMEDRFHGSQGRFSGRQGGRGFPGKHGHGGHGPNPPPFLSNVSKEALDELHNIMENEELTKAELEAEIEKWAQAQGEEIAQQFAKVHEESKEKDQAIKDKMNEMLLNLTDLLPKLEAIKANMEITRADEQEEIMLLFSEVSPSLVHIIKMLEKEATMEAMVPPEVPEVPEDPDVPEDTETLIPMSSRRNF